MKKPSIFNANDLGTVLTDPNKPSRPLENGGGMTNLKIKSY
ncbi:MAG TPA: hypothetical protein VF941_21165 [Clostridia bacterium]